MWLVISLPLLGIKRNETERDITTKGVTTYPVNTALSYLLAEVDTVTTQLEFPVVGVTNASGNGLLFLQFFQWTQLMIGINEELAESGVIGCNAINIIKRIHGYIMPHT